MRRRLLTWAVLVAALPLLLTACSGSEQPAGEQTSAGDVALMYVAAFRGEEAALKEYNPESAFSDEYFESLGASSQQAWGVTFDEQQAARVAAAYRKALSAVKAEVANEQVDGDTAVVTLSVTGLTFDDAMKKQAATFTPDPKDPAASYAKLLVDTLATTKPATRPTQAELTFTKVDGVWLPASEGASALIQAFMQ